MEVDGGRLTDDERMEEDLSLGSKDGDGEVEDEVMMADEGEGVVEVDGDGDIDLNGEGEEEEEYYEDYQEDEDEVIPTIEGEAEEHSNLFTPTVEGGVVPLPVTAPAPAPLVSPFHTGETIPIFTRSDSSTSTSTVFPPAQTQATPALQPEIEATNIDAVPNLITESENDNNVIKAASNSVTGETLLSDLPFIKPTTSSHPHPKQDDNASSATIDPSSSLPIPTSTATERQIDNQDETMPIPLPLPTVPEPAKSVPLDSEANSTSTAKDVPTLPTEADLIANTGADMHADADAGEEGDEEEYFDEDGLEAEDEADIEIEDYPIDSASLPTIILNLPSLGARTLFSPLEDEVKLPIWLKDRQDELAEASLADVWSAIRAECAKEGLVQAGASAGGGGALVIEEKQTDLRMNEDDVNLQSITLLEFLQLYLDCGLAPPVQLHLNWEPRFITRFNLIQNELDAVKGRRSDSANDDPAPEPQHIETLPRPAVQDVGADAKIVVDAVKGKGDDGEQYDEEEYDELDQAEGEGASVKGEDTYSQYGEEALAQHGQTPEPTYNQEVPERHQRDDRAQYAESNYVKDTKDLERDHPNWAAIKKQPTEPLHYSGETRRREIRYSKAEPERENDVIADDVIGGDSAPEAEEQYDDDEEERNDDDASWVDDGAADTIESTDPDHPRFDRSEMNSSAIDQVPLDEVAKLQLRRLQEGTLRRLDSDQEHAKTVVESAEPTAIDATTVHDGALTGVEETEYPLDEVALKTDKDTQIDDGISPQTTDIGSTFPASGLATPAEMSTLSTEGEKEARAMARNILANEPIAEEDEESLDVEDAAQLVNDRAEEQREREELNPPIERETVGIVPPTADEYYEDEYEPDTQPGTPAEEIHTSLESDDEQTLPADDVEYDEAEQEDPSTLPTEIAESNQVDELEPDSIPSATDSSSSKRGYGEDDDTEAEAKRARID